MKFQALIDGVHFDSKKGTVKISLVATSYVSLDELTTIGPRDESVQVILESKQAKLTPYDRTIRTIKDVGAAITIDEEVGVKLKDVAERLKEGGKDEVEESPDLEK